MRKVVALLSGVFFGVVTVGIAGTTARAEDALTYTTTIKDHKFTPDRIEVPAGKAFVLVVKNQENTAVEFESKPLKREKVVKAGEEIKVNAGPLKAGEYLFVDEYNEDVAKGYIVVK